jgi:hypothetical protein
MRSVSRRRARPGESLHLLPAAPVPPGLSWAEGNTVVAEGFARAAAAVERAADPVVPPSVRALLRSRLAYWDGAPPGLSRTWAARAAADLPPADRAAGRLALLVALASYQVDRVTIDEYRCDQPGDAALIALCSWAALSAAREVGGWM